MGGSIDDGLAQRVAQATGQGLLTRTGSPSLQAATAGAQSRPISSDSEKNNVFTPIGEIAN